MRDLRFVRISIAYRLNHFAAMKMIRHTLACALCVAGVLVFDLSNATGVKPATSVVLVDESDGEGTINVQNTDDAPVLLHVRLEHIPEDSEELLIVAPPVSRVDPKQSQMIRFILTNRTPLKTERLMRAVFEGIPSVDKESSAMRVGVSVARNLPVVIHPRGLAPDPEPWKRLKITAEGDEVVLRNESPYVVRLVPTMQLLPQETPLVMPRSYMLPGSVVRLKAQGGLSSAKNVRFSPVSAYGYAAPNYETKLGHADEAGKDQRADAASAASSSVR